MSILQTIENAVTTTEADVVALLIKIKTGVETAESDLDKAIKWLAGNAPAIAVSIQQVENLVEQVITASGGTPNATVTKAIADANAAVTALNAFANAANTGANDAQAVVAGYVAVKQAQAAAAGAAASAAAAPAPAAS